MSESSDYMELSPSKFDQVSACAKLERYCHRYLSSSFIYSRDGRTFSQPRNSFMDMYISGKQVHDQGEKRRCKSKKKFSKKRKQKGKDSTEEFIFPKKTARPISPTSTQDPIETNNSFSDLEQDVEHPPSIDTVTTEVVTPKSPPHPIMLKIKDNFREQIKCISEKFPNLPHCHPPINDRSIANASCTAIGSPPLKSRPSLQAQVSKTMKIRVPDRG
ncbi:hypothetical protein TNCV_3193941 [Trichonephila clavipes]|nr:hypothetical protein TNCV_3193941 [Trichonephila clavipes]